MYRIGLTDQNKLNLVLSHLNSSPHEKLNGLTPLQVAKFMYPDLYEPLSKFGITEIDAIVSLNSIIEKGNYVICGLEPILLSHSTYFQLHYLYNYIFIIYIVVCSTHHSSPAKIKFIKVLGVGYLVCTSVQIIASLFLGGSSLIFISYLIEPLAGGIALWYFISLLKELDDHRIAREQKAE